MRGISWRFEARLKEGLGLNPSECQIFLCSVVFILLCYPGDALEGPISTGVCIFQ